MTRRVTHTQWKLSLRVSRYNQGNIFGHTSCLNAPHGESVDEIVELFWDLQLVMSFLVEPKSKLSFSLLCNSVDTEEGKFVTLSLAQLCQPDKVLNLHWFSWNSLSEHIIIVIF